MISLLVLSVSLGLTPALKVPEGIEPVPVESKKFQTIPLPHLQTTVQSLAEGEVAGTTSFDLQMWGAMGNRVALDEDGNAHICWMHSLDEDLSFPNRDIYYNFWDNATSSFAWPSGVKASGVNRAGYTTCGVMPDGRVVIAFHEQDTLADITYSAVVLDSFPSAGAFGKPVAVDKSLPVIYPHVVVGADGVIHVAGHTSDTGSAGRIIYYSRSTDGGLTFSPWKVITDDGGDDPAIAVSNDGKRVCIAWMSEVPINTGGKDYNCGHINYIESANSGESWGEALRITEGRYPAGIPNNLDTMNLFANSSNIDCAYDNDGNVIVAYTEGWHTWFNGQYYFYPRMWGRTTLWSEASGFGCPTAGHPMFHMLDEETGDTLWEFDSLGMWGVADYVGEEHGGQYGPQIAVLERYGHQYTILTWGGQWDSLDIFAGGTANGDIYGSVIYSGKNWQPLDDYYEHDIGTVWEHVTNITNTHAPGAAIGSTPDEDYHTSWPWIGEDGILHFTYIKDLSAGAASLYPLPWVAITQNPVMYLRYTVETDAIDEKPQLDAGQLAFISTTGRVPLELRLSAPLSKNGILRVRNVLGQTVKKLEVSQGATTITWSGLDNHGRPVPAGVYFFEVKAGNSRGQGKVTLVR